MKRIAIIGGGIAGLSTAIHLDKVKFEVTLFDKGRGKGGRVSTRRKEGFHFDHGAQYISTTTQPFQSKLEEWKRDGVIEYWNGKIGEIENQEFRSTFEENSIFVGVPKMSQIGNYLAEKLENVKLNYSRKITEVTKKFSQWYLIDEYNNRFGGFDFIVVTLPPPQAKALLFDFKYLVDILDRCSISPRWALLLGFEEKLPLDYDGGFVSSEEKSKRSSIRWIARDNSKPKRPDNEAWVVHASKEWTLKHLEKDNDWIEKELLTEFQNITGLENVNPSFIQAHRWRFAIVDKPLDQDFILDNNRNIALAGDYCVGNNIEAAYRSGENLGNRLNGLRI